MQQDPRYTYGNYPQQSYAPHSQHVAEGYSNPISPTVAGGWSQHHSQPPPPPGYEVNPSAPHHHPMWLPPPPSMGHHHSTLPAHHTLPLPSPSHGYPPGYEYSVGASIPSPEESPRDVRAESPGQADLAAYGNLNYDGTWSCAFPGCTSHAVFTRGCDLRKHHKRHTKSFFCRHPGCSQATGGGFSSKKDLARHEAKHNPGIVCEWQGCDRIFSRTDNMRDHVKRIHLKGQKAPSSKPESY